MWFNGSQGISLPCQIDDPCVSRVHLLALCVTRSYRAVRSRSVSLKSKFCCSCGVPWLAINPPPKKTTSTHEAATSLWAYLEQSKRITGSAASVTNTILRRLRVLCIRDTKQSRAELSQITRMHSDMHTKRKSAFIGMYDFYGEGVHWKSYCEEANRQKRDGP